MNNIKKARISSGISQKSIAITLGVSQPTVSGWENGENPTASNLLQLAELLNCSTDYLLGVPDDAYSASVIRVPVLGVIPAGIPIEAIEDVLDYEEVPIHWGRGGKEYFGLRIKGDSMSPKYLDKDTVIFQVSDTCDSGVDCAVIVNGDNATFKQVIKRVDGVVLQPINLVGYSPVFYNNKECNDLPVRVIGIAKEIRRKI